MGTIFRVCSAFFWLIGASAFLIVYGSGDSSGGGGSSGAISGPVAQFNKLMNDHRERVGCGRLAWHGGMAKVAKSHSDDMAARNFYAHTNPDGVGPGGRLRAAGIQLSRWAENINRTHSLGAQAALDGWLTSRPHRATIEDCSFSVHGVGLNKKNHWTWTQMFGRL